jgi:CheY-like chemotaxis protein
MLRRMIDHSKTTVIAVDDEQDNLDLYRRALAGYRVLTFAAPREAVGAVLSEDPACLVLDYRMPELDGVALLRECRTAGYEGSALMVTAYAELDELAYAEQTNLVYRILPKPIVPKHFRDQVDLVAADSRFRRHLEGQRRYPRFCLPLNVAIEQSGKWSECAVHNISLGGLRVESTLRAVSGQPIQIRLTRDGRVVDTRARVVHAAADGAGVQFVDPSSDFLRTVGELLVGARYDGHTPAKPD